MQIKIADHLVRAAEFSTFYLSIQDCSILAEMADALAKSDDPCACVMKHQHGFVVFVGAPTFNEIKEAGASEKFVEILDATLAAGDVMYLAFHADLPPLEGVEEVSPGLMAMPDAELTSDQLASKYAGPDGTWGVHPDYPREDWQYEVANGDTLSGYWQWVASCIERDAS